MNGPIIALNITSEDLKLAEISFQNGRRIARNLRHFRSEQDNNFNATDVIKKFIQEERPKTLKAFLVINSLDLDYKDFSLPFDSKKKVTGAIRFEISSEYPPNEYIVDHIESMTREPGKKSFLAAIASQEMLRKRVNEAEDAGLQIAGITSDLSTIGNYFHDENEALVMEMGERQTLFVLYTHGVPVLMRDIPIGIKDIDSKGPEIASNSGLRPLIGEIKRTIHSFNSKTGFDLNRLYVSGNVLIQQEILEALKENLELEFIEETPQMPGFNIEKPGDDLNIFASVLGAAGWRRKNRSFNFFKDEFLEAEPRAIGRSCLRWGSLTLIFFLLTVLLSSWLKIVALEQRKNFLSTEMREVFSTTFPQTKRIVDEVRQAKNFLNTRSSTLGGEHLPLQTSILDVLEIISHIIPKETNFQIMNLFWERGKIEINGKTDSFKAVNIIQELLSGSQHFSDVNMYNAKLRNDGQDVEFKITIRLAG